MNAEGLIMEMGMWFFAMWRIRIDGRMHWAWNARNRLADYA